MTAALGRWLELVARYDALRGWASWGATSCAEWLAWRCSLSPVTAREHVRVARRLTELPLIAGALRRGELSFSKVRAVCRLDHVSDEEQVLELARHATASQLERFVRLSRGVTRAEASAAVRDRHLHVDFDDDGTAEIRVRVPAEDGALLLRALDHVSALLDAPAEEPAPGDDPAEEAPRKAGWTPPRSPGRRADALVWMADHALSASADEDPGRATGDRREVVVHVDAALLTAQEGPA